MTSKWQIRTLGDIADVKGGKRVPKGHKLQLEPTDYPYITVSDFTDAGTVDASAIRYVTSEVFKQIKRYTISSGDIYLSIAGTIGKTGSVPPELDGASLTENACKLVLRPGIDRGFLYYFTQTDDFTEQAGTNTRTAAQPKLALERLKTIRLSVPSSVPEQKRIVAILDQVFAAIATAKAHAEKNLQNARAIFDSHLQFVFTHRGPGWVVRTVSEIAKHSLGKMLDKAKNKGELRPYLRNLNVRWFAFDLSDLLQMPFLPSEKEKYTAINGDVLICEGGYPGRAAIWDEGYPTYFQKALHRVRFHELEHNKWFVYYLYAQDTSQQLKQHFSGTGIQHFTGEVLARFKVPLPPLLELRRAVAKLDELHEETQRLESIYRRKLVALEELKKSLLHQAFAGKL